MVFAASFSRRRCNGGIFFVRRAAISDGIVTTEAQRCANKALKAWSGEDVFMKCQTATSEVLRHWCTSLISSPNV